MQLAPATLEGLIRLASFGSILVVMALLEIAMPMRKRSQPRLRRWPTNIAIVGLGAIVVRALSMLAAPLAATGAAVFAEAQRLGFLNLWDGPPILEIALSVVVLDAAIYLQHVASHKVGLLWRLHQVHHADRDIDVTTGTRFHPVEIGLSMLYKSALVVVLGVSPLAVLLFEVILNGTAMFNHANVRLPAWVDRPLRLLLVTPDMHRVHHSVLKHERDTNYGFALSLWDRLFGTYTDAPEHGHEHMRIGLDAFQTEAPARLGWALVLPFRRKPAPDQAKRQ
jgi:sterol desaturase/sphingolipid hydroxylase (fatty acid hydroxylase superfamily)